MEPQQAGGGDLWLDFVPQRLDRHNAVFRDFRSR